MPEYTDTISNLERRIESLKRELASAHHDFRTLWNDERIMRLRFNWLEDAARDVVNACPEHLPRFIVKLADELGIEIKETDND